MEKLANLLFGLMNGRHHNMGWFLAGHLNDKFAQVAG